MSGTMKTYLDAILASHRERALADTRPLDGLIEQARDQPLGRDFRAALVGADGLAVIAEVKRRSPSKGDLAPDLDPALLADHYQRAGATCLSVLTDEAHFGGSVADLIAARSACDLPTLRKDFTVSERDVCDARLMGADCVLLIVAALDQSELVAFHQLAAEVGIDALVEVHDEAELERALAVGATLVGVNQRDLVTFEVDHDRAVRMATEIDRAAGGTVLKVAESGIRNRDDAVALRAAGYDAILVGETLVTSPDPRAELASLLVD